MFPSSVRSERKFSAVPMGLFMLMTFNPAINGWAIFSEDGFSEASFTACRVMAKRLRDVCALPESEPVRACRTRLRRPRPGLSLKIAQPFMAGFTVRDCSKSRHGRKKCSAVPAGLDFMLMTFNPAINGWAIISKACRVMAKRLRDVCALPESSCSGAPDAAASSAPDL